ncbi:uncharacterized protein LOC103133143 isoform X3 [Poecilia formosa]|uniref:uncharacterized protein LOC103133143 isoform X3 n=1 Tax=Poecilia formosa TaxID=48698 RepID=UPI0007BA8F64|nr:PREDICTED: uncharacterized protein LOC103133143 isoform X3 [Poecilia formosa]
MDRPCRLLLLSELCVRNVAYDVSLSRSLLTWKRRASSPVYRPFRASVNRSVPVTEIISVREEQWMNGSDQKDDSSWKKIKGGDRSDCRQAFTGSLTFIGKLAHHEADLYRKVIEVLYVERCRQHHWRCAEVNFTCPDGVLCQNWPPDPEICWSTSIHTVGSVRANASMSRRWRHCSLKLGSLHMSLSLTMPIMQGII